MSYSVITISREFGTGARVVGKELADKLGYAYYDRALIQLAAEKSGLSAEYIERSEDKAKGGFFANVVSVASSSAYVTSGINLQYTPPGSDRLFLAQSEVIRDLAKQGSCVIIGRCADYICQSYIKSLLRVHLYGSLEDRVKRCIELYGYEPENAERELHKVDKGRANYHKFYTGLPWKDMSQYDVCIDTSKTGLEKCVDALYSLIAE
jgi:cytidylate kinase